jgi:hypothetical protein
MTIRVVEYVYTEYAYLTRMVRETHIYRYRNPASDKVMHHNRPKGRIATVGWTIPAATYNGISDFRTSESTLVLLRPRQYNLLSISLGSSFCRVVVSADSVFSRA